MKNVQPVAPSGDCLSSAKQNMRLGGGDPYAKSTSCTFDAIEKTFSPKYLPQVAASSQIVRDMPSVSPPRMFYDQCCQSVILSVSRITEKCEIGDFRFISISHSHEQIFMKNGKTTDTDKVMNPQHFGSDLADILIQINL